MQTEKTTLRYVSKLWTARVGVETERVSCRGRFLTIEVKHGYAIPKKRMCGSATKPYQEVPHEYGTDTGPV